MGVDCRRQNYRSRIEAMLRDVEIGGEPGGIVSPVNMLGETQLTQCLQHACMQVAHAADCSDMSKLGLGFTRAYH